VAATVHALHYRCWKEFGSVSILPMWTHIQPPSWGIHFRDCCCQCCCQRCTCRCRDTAGRSGQYTQPCSCAIITLSKDLCFETTATCVHTAQRTALLCLRVHSFSPPGWLLALLLAPLLPSHNHSPLPRSILPHVLHSWWQRRACSWHARCRRAQSTC
jgi:hypothetical protein